MALIATSTAHVLTPSIVLNWCRFGAAVSPDGVGVLRMANLLVSLANTRLLWSQALTCAPGVARLHSQGTVSLPCY